MSGFVALTDSYRAMVKALGPALARLELWREADRRARRITERLVPDRYFSPGFRFNDGGREFERRAVNRGSLNAKRLMLQEYARDQILAKLERRKQIGAVVTEVLNDRL